jgi:anti-anti-sigma factor
VNAVIEESPNLTCVKATGRLDFEASSAFQTQMEAAVAGAAKRAAAVVIDCSGLEYVSSAGLRVFLVAARAAKAANIGFAVCALTPTVKEVFEVSGFGRIIDVHADLATATAKLG